MSFALVIDDNRQMADSLCKLLKLFDIDARPVYGPRASIIALEKTNPAIIFLDVRMPGIDGLEVLAYIRREPRLQRTPVFIVSSDDQPETMERAYEGGVDGYLIKPVTAEALEQALRDTKLIQLR